MASAELSALISAAQVKAVVYNVHSIVRTRTSIEKQKWSDVMQKLYSCCRYSHELDSKDLKALYKYRGWCSTKGVSAIIKNKETLPTDRKRKASEMIEESVAFTIPSPPPLKSPSPSPTAVVGDDLTSTEHSDSHSPPARNRISTQYSVNNNYQTFLAAKLVIDLCESMRLRSVVKYAAIETLHSFIHRAKEMTTTSTIAKTDVLEFYSYAKSRHSTAGMKRLGWDWENDIAALSVAAVCVACKVHSDVFPVPRFKNVLEALFKVIPKMPIIRPREGVSEAASTFERLCVRSLDFNFTFSRPLDSLSECGSVLQLDGAVVSRAYNIWKHKAFWISDLCIRYTPMEIAIAVLLLSIGYTPREKEGESTLLRWCSFFEVKAADIRKLLREVVHVKDLWIPKMDRKCTEDSEEFKKPTSPKVCNVRPVELIDWLSSENVDTIC